GNGAHQAFPAQALRESRPCTGGRREQVRQIAERRRQSDQLVELPPALGAVLEVLRLCRRGRLVDQSRQGFPTQMRHASPPCTATGASVSNSRMRARALNN